MREREKIFGYLCARGRSFPPTGLHFHCDLRCSWFIIRAVNCTDLKTSEIESLIFNFGSTVSCAWYIWWEIIQIVLLKVWSYLKSIGAICDLGAHEQISVTEGERIVPDRVNYVRISILREKNIQKLLLQLHNTEQIFLMSIWHEKNKEFLCITSTMACQSDETTGLFGTDQWTQTRDKKSWARTLPRHSLHLWLRFAEVGSCHFCSLPSCPILWRCLHT